MDEEQPQPQQRQLTIDAAVAVLQSELRHLEQAISERDRRMEARMEAMARVQTETLDRVNEANGKAATALRLSNSNTTDIQQLQEWKQRHDDAIAPLGGTEGAVERLRRLALEEREADVRRAEWKKMAGLIVGGITVGASVAVALNQIGVFP